jgi:acetyltransferase-like isoleucine patch superfamily enzyme
MKPVKFADLVRRGRTFVGRLRRSSVYLADKFPGQKIGPFSYGEMIVFRYGDSDANLEIGNYCSFAADVKIFLGGEHRTDWVSTYPFNALHPEFSHIEGHPRSKGDVRIGNDVWLGRGAVVLSGVTIGDGAAVGAYSVVTKDVPDYAIVGGNPAKLLKMRFPPEVVERLRAIQWWNWSPERVKRAVPYLQNSNIEEFIRLVNGGQL